MDWRVTVPGSVWVPPFGARAVAGSVSKWVANARHMVRRQEGMEGSRAGGRGQQPHEPWCVQICCRSLVSDSALCYQDLMTSVRCRAPPTMRCAGVGCCVLYCGLIAAALMALATMNPV